MHYYSQYVQYCLFTSQDVSLPVLKFSVKEKEDAFAWSISPADNVA